MPTVRTGHGDIMHRQGRFPPPRRDSLRSRPRPLRNLGVRVDLASLLRSNQVI